MGSKGFHEIIKIQQQKLQDLNNKIEDEEAEIERLYSQIGELSRKIEKEPEKNDLEKVIADAKGTALYLRLIKVVINKDVESVMYTIQSEENGDQFTSSQDSEKVDDLTHTFSDSNGNKFHKFKLGDFHEAFLIKVYGRFKNESQILLNPTHEISLSAI